MDKSVLHYQSEVSTIRTGRASTALLDSIKVDFYGTLSPLNNIALISAPDAHLITIQPYDPGALEAIEKAITLSDVDLTPNNDGSIIRLSIPPLTEERRKELVKLVHKVIEDGRISIRNIRRDSNDRLKGLEISEDNLKIELDNIQDLTNEFIEKLNKIQDNKEKEILQ
jgi:ribosome recycling factor